MSGLVPLNDLPQAFQETVKQHGSIVTFGKKGAFTFYLASKASATSQFTFSEPKVSPDVVDSPVVHWWTVTDFGSAPGSSTITSANTTLDNTRIRDHLLTQYGDWKSPFDQAPTEKSREGRIIRTIIERGCLPSSAILQIPLVNPCVQPYWSTATKAVYKQGFWERMANGCRGEKGKKGRIVLLGDAAHETLITFGNGASSAIEDAVAYAKFLAHHYGNAGLKTTSGSGGGYNYSYGESEKGGHAKGVAESEVFDIAARDYEGMRRPRVEHLRRMGRDADTNMELGWIGDAVRDWALRLLCEFFSL